MGQLAQQIGAFNEWKQGLQQNLEQLASWMQNNQLLGSDLQQQLDNLRVLLEHQDLTLAFVGEFSRGKTELINALFFSGYRSRILPSQPGRTTMCPTEFFYDAKAPYPYIRLLPIESRQSGSSIADFCRIPQHWKELRLDPDDPDALRDCFQEVARTRAVPPQKAEQLGFAPGALERSPSDPELVIIPAWRQALVNFRHPLLQSGLRILDTPGLNALGSEPELTLSMLPRAQAVLFLLSADTGITASDMSIWEGHLQHLANRRYALLNKIDSLWDDIQGERFTTEQISRQHRHTAQQLGLDPGQVIALSAKQALKAKIEQNPTLLQRSGLLDLEHLLGEELIGHQEELLEEQVVHPLAQLLHQCGQQLQLQLERFEQQRREFEHNPIDQEGLAHSLGRLTESELLRYQKQLIALRPSRRLIEQQTKTLVRSCREDGFSQLVQQTHRRLNDSLTTLGIGQVIGHFFRTLYQDLHPLEIEYRLAERMVSSLYQRFAKDLPGQRLAAPELNLEQQMKLLRDLHKRADRYHLQLGNLLSPKPLLIRRFFNTLMQEVQAWHEQTCRQVNRFTSDALLPLMQGLLQHKELLEQQLKHLQHLQQRSMSRQQRLQELDRMIEAERLRLRQVEQLHKALLRPSPVLSHRKVVRLPGTHGAA